jgi:ABC-type dipeptide/oligopeptide/nickel transport system permease subunit
MSGQVPALDVRAVDPTLVQGRSASLLRDTVRGILRQRSAQAGVVILAFLLLLAIFADVVAPFGSEQDLRYPPVGEQVNRLASPCLHVLGCAATSPQHLFGVDGNFFDVFSRVVYGARISLFVGFVTVGFAIVLGTLIGAVAGYAGGWVDNLFMRLMDVVLSFPSLILAIAIVTVIGSGLFQAQLAIGIVAIPIYARLMRASVLSVKERDFVVASRALGESDRGILFRRILPNALTPLIVQGTLGIGGAVLEVAALSFLGLGAQPPTAEWGSMIGLNRNFIFNAPHLIIFPGIALSLTVLGFNLLGDGMRDALDPRLNR